MALPLSDEDLEILEAAIGGYMLAVASLVMRVGVPLSARNIDVWTEKADGPEGESSLNFPPDYPARFCGHGATRLHVKWDSLSGWYVKTVYLRTDPHDDPNVHRFMGAGLVPEPQEVADFIAKALTDLTGTGTHVRPYYRSVGEDLYPLIERLTVHCPGGRRYSRDVIECILARTRQESCYQRTLDELDVTEPVRSVPLRQGELQALCRILDWVDDTHEWLKVLSLALASDLRSRFAASGSDVPGKLPLVEHYQEAQLIAQNTSPIVRDGESNVIPTRSREAASSESRLPHSSI